MKLQTSCEHCVFREGFGCQLDLHEKYGIVPPEEGQDFNVLERVCMSRRDSNWDHAHSTDPTLNIVDEWRVPVAYVVIFDGNFEALDKSLASITQQAWKPSKERIVLVCQPGEDLGKCRERLNHHFDHSNHFICELLDLKSDPLEQLDAVFNRVFNGYYVLIENGHEIPSELVYTLCRKIFLDCVQFVAIVPKEGLTGICVSALIHKWLKGNSADTLIDKIKALDPNMVLEWKDV